MFLSCIFVSLAGGLLILLTFSNNQLFVSLTFRFFISLISALLLFATSIEVQIGVYAPSVACLDSWMGKSLHLPGGWQYPTRHLLITFLAGRDTGAYLLLSMCSSWNTSKEWGHRGREVAGRQRWKCRLSTRPPLMPAQHRSEGVFHYCAGGCTFRLLIPKPVRVHQPSAQQSQTLSIELCSEEMELLICRAWSKENMKLLLKTQIPW